jgi:MFS family permease
MSSVASTTASERNWIIGLIGVGHFFSHFVMLCLPPLFLLMKPALGVGYTELGAIVAAMAVTTAIGQIPMGFMVDRIGGRAMLLLGLSVMGVCLICILLTTEYWQLLALFAVIGLGNSVFHPADYAILSARLDDSVFGRAVSIHSLTGYLGWAGAALVMVPLGSLMGWRAALSVIGAIGLIIVAAMILGAHHLDDSAVAKERTKKLTSATDNLRDGVKLMLSMPILMMFLFFAMTATATSGLMAFAIPATVGLHGLDEVLAGSILTSHLVAGAVGVLIGGWLADQTRRHNLVASFAIVGMAFSVAVMAYDEIGVILLVTAMLFGGLFYGISSPSRDVLIKRGTPPGSEGVTFGFTSTGMSIGNFVGPLTCGWIMDRGDPALLFTTLASIIVLSIITIMMSRPVRSD